MSFSIIVAIAENHAIGRNNELLWHISEDLKRFKKLTTGHPIIMGKNTFLSLPNGALPKRKNIVITDNPEDCFDDCVMVGSIREAMDAGAPDGENFIIGGGSIYEQFMPHADKLYLTLVHKEYDADVFFPEIRPEEWEEVSREAITENDPPYSYIILIRK